MENKINNVREIIEDTISIIPGVIKFDSINKENNIDQHLIINNIEENKIDVKVGLIVDRNILINNLSKQINEALEYNLKRIKITLLDLSIYIIGVK